MQKAIPSVVPPVELASESDPPVGSGDSCDAKVEEQVEKVEVVTGTVHSPQSSSPSVQPKIVLDNAPSSILEKVDAVVVVDGSTISTRNRVGDQFSSALS